MYAQKKVVPAAAATQKSASAPMSRPNFAAFRRQMQQLKSASEEPIETESPAESNPEKPATNTPAKRTETSVESDAVKVFDGGFFSVCSPVRQSPASAGNIPFSLLCTALIFDLSVIVIRFLV